MFVIETRRSTAYACFGLCQRTTKGLHIRVLFATTLLSRSVVPDDCNLLTQVCQHQHLAATSITERLLHTMHALPGMQRQSARVHHPVVAC